MLSYSSNIDNRLARIKNSYIAFNGRHIQCTCEWKRIGRSYSQRCGDIVVVHYNRLHLFFRISSRSCLFGRVTAHKRNQGNKPVCLASRDGHKNLPLQQITGISDWTKLIISPLYLIRYITHFILISLINTKHLNEVEWNIFKCYFGNVIPNLQYFIHAAWVGLLSRSEQAQKNVNLGV